MNFVTRAWGDGTDFIGTDIFRDKDVKAGRSGFGDMICEVSNLIAQTDEATIHCPKMHSAYKPFVKMINHDMSKYEWKTGKGYSERIGKNWDDQNNRFNILHCYPDFPYVKLDPKRFSETHIPGVEYATIQTVPFSKKCGYTKEIMDGVKAKYNLPIVDVGGQEHLGLDKIAYIIHNAKFHIGIDSGMSHFAHTIKPKEDVHIYVPKNRCTGVTYRWINQGYNVELI